MWTDLTELVVLTLLLSVPSGTAVPLSSFYSYGSAAGDSVLPPTDDGSSPAITLPAPFLFFGANYYTIYVSRGGYSGWTSDKIRPKPYNVSPNLPLSDKSADRFFNVIKKCGLARLDCLHKHNH